MDCLGQQQLFLLLRGMMRKSELLLYVGVESNVSFYNARNKLTTVRCVVSSMNSYEVCVRPLEDVLYRKLYNDEVWINRHNIVSIKPV